MKLHRMRYILNWVKTPKISEFGNFKAEIISNTSGAWLSGVSCPTTGMTIDQSELTFYVTLSSGAADLSWVDGLRIQGKCQ